MAASDSLDFASIDRSLADLLQGDVCRDDGIGFVHVFSCKIPLTPAAHEIVAGGEATDQDQFMAATSDVDGFVIISQTCDLVRLCSDRPFVEVAALQKIDDAGVFAEIKAMKRPQFAWLPTLDDQKIVADLDRVMTVEKAVIAALNWTRGIENEEQGRAFAAALARKRARFAFPDDFNAALSEFQKRMTKRAQKSSEEGAHVDCLREIRASAAPTWNESEVEVTIWLIKERNPAKPAWDYWAAEWEKLFKPIGAFRLAGTPLVVGLEDMTALEYQTSERLDLDYLSRSKTL